MPLSSFSPNPSLLPGRGQPGFIIVVLYTDGGEGSEGVPPHILAFMEHYFSLTWMTYRAHFTPIPGTMLTTDCGWGCMVRSGQMMLATVLHYHLLSRGQLCMCTIPCTYMTTVLPCNSSDWRLSASRPSEKAVHKQVPPFNIAH